MYVPWSVGKRHILTNVPKYLAYMYWFSCYKVLKFCMLYSSVQTETKLLYGWVVGISVRFGDKYQVKNLYAWVKMIKGGKGELHEHPTCVIFLMFLCWTKKNVIYKSTTSYTKMAPYWEVLSNMNRSILYQKCRSHPDFKDTLNGKRKEQPWVFYYHLLIKGPAWRSTS